MNKLEKQTEALIKNLELTILRREEYFSAKSERWQESEKGVVYQEITEQLREAEPLLDEAKDYLTTSA